MASFNPFLDMSEVMCLMKGVDMSGENCRACNKCIKEYYGLCIQCFKNPDWDVVRKQISTIKIKEASVAHYIVSSVDCGRTTAKWRVNFKYGSHCPDVMIDLGDRGIICEVDERAHETYSYDNEKDRVLRLRKKFGRPLKIIRFNPDLIFRNGHGTAAGPRGKCWSWSKDEHNQLYIPDKMKGEWLERLNYIKIEIEKFVRLEYEETFESASVVEYLFYIPKYAAVATPTTGSKLPASVSRGSRKKRTQ